MCLLHFRNTRSDSILSPMLARWGRMNSPLWLNTLATGAVVAGLQKIFSSRWWSIWKLASCCIAFHESSQPADQDCSRMKSRYRVFLDCCWNRSRCWVGWLCRLHSTMFIWWEEWGLLALRWCKLFATPRLLFCWQPTTSWCFLAKHKTQIKWINHSSKLLILC